MKPVSNEQLIMAATVIIASRIAKNDSRSLYSDTEDLVKCFSDLRYAIGEENQPEILNE